MPGEATDNTAPVVTDAPRPTLGALFARLLAEGEAFIRAEVQLYRAQVTQKAFSAGLIVAFVGGAVMLTQALIIVILMGLVLTIAPFVGMGWAVLIIAGATIALIGICVLLARSRVSALLKPEDVK